MEKLKKWTQATFVLAILSLVAIAVSHLALTDIAHGEADLSLEWNVLRGAAITLVVFIGSTLVTIREWGKQISASTRS